MAASGTITTAGVCWKKLNKTRAKQSANPQVATPTVAMYPRRPGAQSGLNSRKISRGNQSQNVPTDRGVHSFRLSLGSQRDQPVTTELALIVLRTNCRLAWMSGSRGG